MSQRQRIALERRAYNQWVADQTLEDYALRFTARHARKSAFRIGNTALGAISFLACEAIGGSITLAFGFSNTAAAILAVGILSFFLGLPIAYHAARAGVDVDLLTRGAGFGYLGSTITSLIYASFTFVLFSIEATIMSVALQMVTGLPLWFAHIISAVIVIPIAAFGIRQISRMQLLTQPIWLLMQFVPLGYIAITGHGQITAWTGYTGQQGAADGSVSLLLFGAAASVLLSLLPQIGEQVDYLRFLPPREKMSRWGWWTALVISGPGWVLIGSLKLLAGSFLTFLALGYGVPAESAAQPAELYNLAFQRIFASPGVALALTGLFVVTCQLKINVTNAYAGSIAWSNFFSRLTHSHPGRVVWLVFNVMLALLLMEIGIFRVIESVLGLYANFAVGWLGAVVADLMINKPLGLSPPYIEFKRAHLYDINPVGVGAMGLSVLVSTACILGFCGPVAQSMSAFIGLVVAFAAAPLIAWATGGRYYLARKPEPLGGTGEEVRCSVCENSFERQDMAFCSAYNAPICSLCCTLEARCHDLCKTESRVGEQAAALSRRLLPKPLAGLADTRLGQFLAIFLGFICLAGALLTLISYISGPTLSPPLHEAIRATLWLVFLSLFIVSGIAAWLLVLAHESRRAAEGEFERQAVTLMQEIEAHERTDAALQKAKEVAEAANLAKSRYIVGLSHEIRAPLNSIFGYAQLLEADPAPSDPAPTDEAVGVIRRSAEHLSDLVDSLLDISRIETGTLVLDRDKLCLPDLLDQMAAMFALQARAKGVEFRYTRAPNLPDYVHADEKRLRQILINLLSNAVKYTEAGYAGLNVRYRNHLVSFEVSDSGMGIPPEDLDRIFLPFERGSQAPARAMPGTGLGLTITKLLTEIMGGTIAVRSAPGEGTSVTVQLLLFAAEPAAATTPRARIRGYAGKRRTVLTADDDPAHLDLLRRMLEPVGFTVLPASGGRMALDLAAAQAPDIALLDISMPAPDGWEVARRLRAAHPQMVIVMVSANAHDRQEADRGAGRAHDAFLTKPFEQARLFTVLEELVGIEWITAPPAVAPAPAAPSASLAPGDIAELINLGEIGYVQGIRDKLDEIAAADTGTAPLIGELRALVGGFDLAGYLTRLRGLGA